MQKGSSDCAICCLRMLLGVDYGTVVAAIPRRTKPLKNGLSTRQIQMVARKLGFTLRFRKGFNEDEDHIGILDLSKPGKTEMDYHVVLYFNDSVYDPSSGLLYTDVAAYLLASGYQIDGFYWRES